jgi:hypothetical protein
MPIQEGNIVFVRHQVMDDVPEGGGAATGMVIADGAVNTVTTDHRSPITRDWSHHVDPEYRSEVV